VTTEFKRKSEHEERNEFHIDHIDSVVSGEGVLSDAAEVEDSWKRCTLGYHLDPGNRSAPNILTESELRICRESFENVIAHTQEEIDRLYAILRESGYVILLCDPAGVAVQHRGNQSQADQFKHWGIWGGGVWSEEVEGTNAIGTCIIEQGPVVVHRGQHFRARHAELSCSAAPIYDAYGRLVSVLDCSSFDSQASDRAHRFALGAAKVSARTIEERLFRDAFHHAWNIAAEPLDESVPALLLAIDEDHRVIGADRVARSVFSLDDKRLAGGVPLSALYSYESTIIRANNEQDIVAQLREVDGSREWRALITPPASGPGGRQFLTNLALHLRPRIALLNSIPAAEPLSSNRGGLPPQVTRRIREYIDARTNENIPLEAMAELAGLSVFHFARAFRRSFGLPPHSYLLHRRIARAHSLLQQTDIPVSEIALSTGFSDQSHFARHFRRLTGMAPGQARWNQR
jgi:AraC-like DNA-binding protein/PAS domain-containing protein